MKLIRRILLYVIIIAIIGVGIFIGIGYLGYRDAVAEEGIEEKVEKLRSDEHYTTIENISEPLKDAVVAIEDRRFYEHEGVDYYALVRSIVVNVSNQGKQGGSTLTQQLAKNFYFMDDNSGVRKLSEAFIARSLESKYSKDEILEMYLNIVYYGDGFYGVYDASQGYFNTTPDALDIAQASMLAGLPQAPSVYALSNHDVRSLERQKQVLNTMLELQMINKNQYEDALKETIYE